MAAGKNANLARMVVSVGGSGTLTLSTAAPGYLTITQAGNIADGDVVSYGIIDGSASETGSGTVGSSGTTLSSRTVDNSTNSNTAINVSVGAQVFICARRQNLLSFAEAMTWLTETEKAQGRVNLYAAPFDALAFNGMQVNGSMEVAQERGGNIITGVASADYLADNWYIIKLGSMVANGQQVSDAPAGYSKSIKLSITTADASPGATDVIGFGCLIEGYRTSRLALGTASSQSFSFGFWVKAHRTGTYGGAAVNTGGSRSYPFTYVVNASDTWEFKTVTVIPETTGTWDTTTGQGISIYLSLGCGATFTGTPNVWGTSLYLSATGAVNGMAATTDTFQITGMIVLPGIEVPSSTRAPLIMRPFDTELPMVQRYYEIGGAGASGVFQSSSICQVGWQFKTKRIAPTIALTTTAPIITEPAVPADRTGSGSAIAVPTTPTVSGSRVIINGFSSAAANNGAIMLSDYLIANARF